MFILFIIFLFHFEDKFIPRNNLLRLWYNRLCCVLMPRVIIYFYFFIKNKKNEVAK